MTQELEFNLKADTIDGMLKLKQTEKDLISEIVETGVNEAYEAVTVSTTEITPYHIDKLRDALYGTIVNLNAKTGTKGFAYILTQYILQTVDMHVEECRAKSSAMKDLETFFEKLAKDIDEQFNNPDKT